MNAMNDTAMRLEKAADTLPERITCATKDKVTQHGIAENIVTCHRIGLDRGENTIDFILTFATYDDDGCDDDAKYTAVVYIDTRADGTPDSMLVNVFDNFNDNNADGRNANIEAATVDESADTAATIIVDLLRRITAETK